MSDYHSNFKHSREAAEITLDKVSSWEDLNAVTLEKGDEKFSEKTKELWEDFAVHGILAFDKEKGERVLKPFTDLDGNSAVGILKLAGVNVENLTYVKPGESVEGAINMDTGDKFGVVYNEDEKHTAYFDHHEKQGKEISSATEVMYKTMIDLGMLEGSESMDRLVDFVNKIDNRKYAPEEFLRSAKTILGLQRGLKFEQIVSYFEDHQSPTEELTPEEFQKYGLKQSAERQQKTVDEAMEKLEEMGKEGKVISTSYGKVVINKGNELKVGASAAYVKYDGIINMTPEKSFAVTFKERNIDEEALKEKLGDKFQGKIIRGKMWIYNGKEPLRLTTEDIVEALG